MLTICSLFRKNAHDVTFIELYLQAQAFRAQAWMREESSSQPKRQKRQFFSHHIDPTATIIHLSLLFQ